MPKPKQVEQNRIKRSSLGQNRRRAEGTITETKHEDAAMNDEGDLF
jgi:hypothetical protein